MGRAERDAVLRRRLEALYRHYDARFVDPDPLEYVRRQESDADREVVGLVASSLAFGGVPQIKRSIETVLDVLGPRPAAAVAGLDPPRVLHRLRRFKHRWSTGRDVTCLLWFIRRMRETHGSVEAFFAAGHDAGAPHVGGGLASFTARALA
ncbi:MAG TPA: DUF2400 family protein, partial [Vicinamibacteria bacterium]|nr:DUF2400 family protein [Vicinamibacteria bacterium]